MILLFALGCADYDLRGDNEAGAMDSGLPLEPGLVALRLDAWPAATAPDGTPLLPQSFLTEAQADEQIVLNLRAPVLVQGILTGFTAAPSGVVAVPGTQGPLLGRVEFMLPGTPMGEVVLTDDLGAYAAQVVAGEGWQVAFVPESPELPFEVWSDLALLEDTILDEDLELADPVFGRITSDGVGLAGVQVGLTDASTGVHGTPAFTDTDGRYALRAYPGAYTLTVVSPSAAVPTREVELIVEEGAGGALVDLDFGAMTSTAVFGTVVGPSGAAMAATVHLKLDESENGVRQVLDYAADCDRNGNFVARVVPGVYDIEVVSPWGSSAGSFRMEDVVIAGDSVDMGSIDLPWRARLEHTLLGPDGQPVPGAQVRVQELGFEGYVFETTTSATGWFALDVTDTRLRWTITPPAESSAAITTFEADPSEVGPELELDAGQLVTGSVSWGGEGLPYTAVDVWTQDGTFLTSTLTDEQGAFALRIAPE